MVHKLRNLSNNPNPNLCLPSFQLAHWRPADSPKFREGREGTFTVSLKTVPPSPHVHGSDPSWTLRQCVAGWRFIPGAAVSPGTLWWRSGRSYRGRRTTSSCLPACRCDDAVAAAPTKPWSAFPRSRTRSPWRYLLRHGLNPGCPQVRLWIMLTCCFGCVRS